MNKFAKLYENESIGQILVKIDSAEDGDNEAEVRIYFEPKGFGVCSTAVLFKDWDAAEEAFEKVEEKLCIEVVEKIVAEFGGLAG
jgi:hypothetical protein